MNYSEKKNLFLTFASYTAAAILIWIIAYKAIVRLYYINGPSSLMFPYTSIQSEKHAAVILASTSSFAAIAVIGIGYGLAAHSRLKQFWAVSIMLQLSLPIYGVAGIRFDGAAIFPELFFREYNWLTYITEVAPLLSMFAAFVGVVLVILRRKRTLAGGPDLK